MPTQSDTLPSRYHDVELIGRGGMGEIYRARDDALDRTVAVKVLADRYAADDEIRRRFKREALAAARLSGEPGIVTIFDVGEWGGRPFIVMEYLEGGSLEDVLRRGGTVPPGRALAWIDQAARALDAAHANGVVHRDVKPGNLLLDRNDEVDVADFGIASAAGLDSMTKTGTILGTVGYLAPEQARGARASAASDRYGLAVVAYELLAGRRPFESESATAEALAHVQAPVPAISELSPDLPADLDGVFERALAKDPQARFGSASEFAHALREAFSSVAGTTAAVAPTAVAPPPRGPTTTPREYGSVPTPPRRRRSRLPFLLAALLLLGLGGVAVAALVADDDGGETARERPRTVERTITTEGEVETVTVTTPAEPPPAPEPAPPPPPPADEGASGAALNDQGFALMQQGRYEEALPYFERALEQLQGTGELAEAYTLYNLAFTRLQLGNCEGVLELLDRSENIQGQRSEIDRARSQAREQCGGGDG